MIKDQALRETLRLAIGDIETIEDNLTAHEAPELAPLLDRLMEARNEIFALMGWE